MNNYATRNNLAKDLKESVSGEDIREGLTAVVSVKLTDPQFEGQTKAKLGNAEVKGQVQTAVADSLTQYLEENPGDAFGLLPYLALLRDYAASAGACACSAACRCLA